MNIGKKYIIDWKSKSLYNTKLIALHGDFFTLCKIFWE